LNHPTCCSIYNLMYSLIPFFFLSRGNSYAHKFSVFQDTKSISCSTLFHFSHISEKDLLFVDFHVKVKSCQCPIVSINFICRGSHQPIKGLYLTWTFIFQIFYIPLSFVVLKVTEIRSGLTESLPFLLIPPRVD